MRILRGRLGLRLCAAYASVLICAGVFVQEQASQSMEIRGMLESTLRMLRAGEVEDPSRVADMIEILEGLYISERDSKAELLRMALFTAAGGFVSVAVVVFLESRRGSSRTL